MSTNIEMSDLDDQDNFIGCRRSPLGLSVVVGADSMRFMQHWHCIIEPLIIGAGFAY
jgi:hypothetical protein